MYKIQPYYILCNRHINKFVCRINVNSYNSDCSHKTSKRSIIYHIDLGVSVNKNYTVLQRWLQDEFKQSDIYLARSPILWGKGIGKVVRKRGRKKKGDVVRKEGRGRETGTEDRGGREVRTRSPAVTEGLCERAIS